jgi:hypothetical protein
LVISGGARWCTGCVFIRVSARIVLLAGLWLLACAGAFLLLDLYT